MESKIAFHNIWKFECHDKYGKLKWTEIVKNMITYEGLNHLLQTYFKGSNYSAAWYAGLIQYDGTLAQTDTAAQIGGTNGWTEETQYDETNRITISWDDAASQSIDNDTSPCVFTMSATTTVDGAFVISENTKGGTSGTLFKEAEFTAPQSVVDNDTITLTITINVASV